MAKSQELFELHFDGEKVFEGEQLYDNKAVEEINKVDKSLWSIMVHDMTYYEVELFSPFTQRMKCSCECSVFKTEKSCKHITAALFALRTQRKEEAERKEEKAKSKAYVPKKLNINTLLQELDNGDLINFIKAYARKDKNFNIALKAHFARRVDLEDNKAKYKSILDSIIRPVSGAATRAKAADLKNFINVSKELMSQLEDALSLSDYKDGYFIIDASISKTEYVRYHYDTYSDDTLVISQRFHELLILLYQRVHAEELKKNLYELILDLPQRSYYRHNRLQDHLYYLLITKEYKNKDLLKEIRAILETIISRKKIDDLSKMTLLSMVLIIDYHLDKLKNIQWFIDEYAKLSMNVVDKLVSVQESQVSVKLMKKMKAHFPKSRELKRKLLQVHLSLDQIKELAALLPKYVIQSDDIPMLYKLESKVSSEQWADIIMLLIKHYQDKPDKIEILANIYFKEDDFESLITLMEGDITLEMVMKYDHALYRTYRKELTVIYKRVLGHILDSYLGDKAQVTVRKALYHIEQIGARKLHRSMITYLETEYKHRLKYIL